MKERRRQQMIERSRPLLPPGTEIRHVIGAQTASQWLLIGLAVLGVIPALVIFPLVNRYRLLAVARDAIYVLDSGRWIYTRPTRVLGVLPRSTRLGPVKGAWATIQAGPERLHVARLFHGAVSDADAEATQAEMSAAAPLDPSFRGPAAGAP